jgi:hypothetical protein
MVDDDLEDYGIREGDVRVLIVGEPDRARADRDATVDPG